MKSKTWFSLSIGALVLAAALPATQALAQTKGGTLNMIVQPEPPVIVTAINQQGPTQFVAGKIYESLLTYTTDLKPQPGLAKSWEAAADGLTYTFHLQDNVKWHDGKPFTADDVVFTLADMLPKTHARARVILNKFVDSVQAPDPKTVVIKLKSPFPAFMLMFEPGFAPIMPKHIYAGTDYMANPANQKPIGTGPFVFSRYQKDAQIRFKGNKDYWKPDEVKVDNLIFAINTDASVRAQKLKAGECQITLNPRPADLDALKKDPNLNLPSQAGFNLGYIAYNVTHKPFDKLEVRQALDMAVNKKAIIDAVYQGAGQLASNGMPPTQWSYDETIKDAPYDPAKARELLKKAGVAEGTEITLWAMPVQRPYNPNAKLMAEMLQNDWAKIGIKAKIVTYEWGEYIKRAKGGEHDAMLIGWSGDNGDPDNWLGTLYGCDAVDGNNFSKWCDAGYDKLVKDAKRTTDQGKRTELYKQAQHILKEQVPITPIAHSTVYQPMRKTVHDFRISPFGLNSFYEVSVGK